MANAGEEVRDEIETIKIEEETVEDISVEISKECILGEEDISGKYNTLQNLACGRHCRGQNALDEHLLERHRSGFVKEEGVQRQLQAHERREASPSILSSTVLPGALWTGERVLTFHHCPECPQSYQCLNAQKTAHLTKALSGRKGGLEGVAETTFHCTKCGKTFQHKDLLKAHLLTHAEALTYSCADDGKPTFAQFDLEETPYRSGACDEGSAVRNAAKRTGEPCAAKHSYSCTDCGVTFHQLSGLRDHEKTHRGSTLYICAGCGKSFSQPRNLQQHHAGETPHRCTDCDRGSGETGSLRPHPRSHTGEAPYQCSLCSKSFGQLENLKRHRRTHTGETPYPCAECGKSFSQLGNLKAHRRIHTGETPFSCHVCGKGFKNKGNLKAHSRVHTGETPFQCKDCGKNFGWLAALKTHRRTHTGERPYRCERCGERFTYSYKLRTHGCQG